LATARWSGWSAHDAAFASLLHTRVALDLIRVVACAGLHRDFCRVLRGDAGLVRVVGVHLAIARAFVKATCSALNATASAADSPYVPGVAVTSVAKLTHHASRSASFLRQVIRGAHGRCLRALRFGGLSGDLC